MSGASRCWMKLSALRLVSCVLLCLLILCAKRGIISHYNLINNLVTAHYNVSNFGRPAFLVISCQERPRVIILCYCCLCIVVEQYV